ncbi:hypothetical protein MHYP_G00266110 [Metynnis hypsauchen]
MFRQVKNGCSFEALKVALAAQGLRISGLDGCLFSHVSVPALQPRFCFLCVSSWPSRWETVHGDSGVLAMSSATVTVLDKKPEMTFHYDSQYEEITAVCEIPLSGSGADFSCNLYTGHLQFLKGESRRRNSGNWSCIFTASKTDLLNRLQSVKSREVSCDYSLNSDPSICSPMSDTYDILNLIPVPTPSSIPEEKSTAGQIFLQLLVYLE